MYQTSPLSVQLYDTFHRTKVEFTYISIALALFFFALNWNSLHLPHAYLVYDITIESTRNMLPDILMEIVNKSLITLLLIMLTFRKIVKRKFI